VIVAEEVAASWEGLVALALVYLPKLTLAAEELVGHILG
jgi:hypothetical protein